MTEQHPLPFFLPANAKILMLGSFPPPRNRWSMDFFYPNFQNDMWRIVGLLFFGDKNHFVNLPSKAFREAEIRAFLSQTGIALGDTATEVVRLKENASDKFLEVVRPIALDEILKKIPECQAIVVTGQKAMDTILTLLDDVAEPSIGSFAEFQLQGRTLRLYRMPSSSRAYPLALEKKAAFYQKAFQEVGVL